MGYQGSHVRIAVLHTDTQVLPKKPLAWASWNYAIDKPTASVADQKPILTYHMNILERLSAKHNYLVTLNTPINEAHVIKRVDYRHPVYDNKMTDAMKFQRSGIPIFVVLIGLMGFMKMG